MKFKKSIIALCLSVALLTLNISQHSLQAAAYEPWLEYAGQGSLDAKLIARYTSGAEFEAGGTEIVAYNPLHQMIYSVNGAEKALDLISIDGLKSNTSNNHLVPSLKQTKRISLEQLSKQSLKLDDITSVAIHPSNQFVAVAAPAFPITDAGFIIFLSYDGTYLSHVQVGVLPDMVTFTPDGKYALVANEAQPSDDYKLDPMGSVSIIDVSNGANHINQEKVATAYFDKLDTKDIRVVKPGASLSEDTEPEYIVVAPDSSKAYVALQENNAIAVLDLTTKQFTSIHDLGTIDHSMPGYALDASDKDGISSLKNWPTLGLFMPDGMSIFEFNGKNYILTANEGDAKDYDGFSEEARIADIADRIVLKEDYYDGFTQDELDAFTESLTDFKQLGRLKTTTTTQLNSEGKQEYIESYGTRSFSVWDADTLELVFDSGDQFERIMKQVNPAAFNTDHSETTFDNRSDDKGVEPESVIVGKVDGRSYSFVGLERAGGIMAYDVSNPAQPIFDLYFSSRSYNENEEAPTGDVAPEGLTFVPADQSPTGTALLLVAHELSGTIAVYELTGSKQTRIQIIATNDIHSRVTQGAGMGYAKIATIVDQLRSMNPNTLVLDAGDTLHGQTYATLVEGESIVELMNEIGYTAMTTGNHDYNYGYKQLLELEKTAQFPILAANVKYKDGSHVYDPYVIEEVAGVKIGIFGIATPETIFKTHPNNIVDITFTDPAAAAKEVVSKLEGEVDIVINLSHLGTDGSTIEANRSDSLASKVSGIDLIIDGHSHEVINRSINDTLLVQHGEYGKLVGIITLVLENGKLVEKHTQVVTADDAATLPNHQKVSSLILETTTKQKGILDQVIGKTNVHLEGERAVVRTTESNLGNLIADAMLAATGAEIALTNGGGIRASISEGNVTKGDVITALPFGNFIVTIEVTGQEVKDALEVGAAGYPSAHGAFAHVSGITYKIDETAESGNRVHSVKINGNNIDLKKTYTLATNDFLATGGDQYTMFADNEIINNAGTLDEELIKYIQKQGSITAKLENRIVVAAKANTDVNESPKSPVAPATPNKNNSANGNKDSLKDGASDNTPQQIVYIVKPGDTLTKIAKQYHTTWQTLQKANSIKNPHRIYPGQKILISKA